MLQVESEKNHKKFRLLKSYKHCTIFAISVKTELTETTQIMYTQMFSIPINVYWMYEKTMVFMINGPYSFISRLRSSYNENKRAINVRDN